MRKVQVRVTQEDIECGTRGSAQCCPVARALQRIVQEPFVRGHGGSYVKEITGVGKVYGDLFFPVSVATFVTSFDKGAMVVPFEFEVEIF